MNSGTPRSASRRVAIFLLLVACFFVQTGFTYFDYPRTASERRLSGPAKEGLALWRKNNCQSCHQIYGFGGFVGPDLTNIVARRPHEDWSDVLTMGRKQMPAFEFEEEQRIAIVAFLTEINETGNSIPHFTGLREGVDADRLVRNYLRAAEGAFDEAVLRGEEQIHKNGCNACHRPFAVGTQGAPDLTPSLSLRSEDYIRDIMLTSKGSMPAYDFLTQQQLDDIMACLSWMNTNRRELGLFYSKKEKGDHFDWATVPWFEY